MGATVAVWCPKCGHQEHVRFDPGPESEHPTLAILELADECPDHGGTSWKFIRKVQGRDE